MAVLSSPAAATPATEIYDKAEVFELDLTNLYKRVLSATKGGRGAKNKVLVNLKVFEINKITFGNKMDNLVPYLKRVSNETQERPPTHGHDVTIRSFFFS